MSLTGSDADIGRRINYLNLGNSWEVNLISTRIGYINGGDGGDHNITLSLANTRPINLYGNKNTINTGSGYVGAIETEKYTGLNISRDVGSLKTRGDARVKLAGNVDLIELREGDHDLRLKTGFAVKLNFSMDVLKVQNNTIEVDVFYGGRIDFCEGNSAGTAIVMEGRGRVRKTDTYAGTNDIATGDRWIARINSRETENTIHISTGGIGSMAISDNAGDLEIIYDGGTILLEDLVGQVLSVSDFAFV